MPYSPSINMSLYKYEPHSCGLAVIKICDYLRDLREDFFALRYRRSPQKIYYRITYKT